jgi:hypothetical protein
MAEQEEDVEGVTQGNEGGGRAEEEAQEQEKTAEEDFLAKAPPLKAFLSELFGSARGAADRTRGAAAEEKKREKYGSWEPDDSANFCQMVFSENGKKCKNPFSLVNRRHHCRECGKLICGRKTCLASELKLVEYSDGSGRVKKKEKKNCTICFQNDAGAVDSAATLAGVAGARVGIAADAATALSSAGEHLETIGGAVGAAAAAARAVPFLGAALKGLSTVLKAGAIDERTRRKCREVTELLGRMEESAKDEKKSGRARYCEELEGKRKELEIVVWRVLGKSVTLRALSSFSDADMTKIDALKTDMDRLITMGAADNVLKNAEGIQSLGKQIEEGFWEVKKLFPQLSQRGLALGTKAAIGSADRGTADHKSDTMYEKAR